MSLRSMCNAGRNQCACLDANIYHKYFWHSFNTTALWYSGIHTRFTRRMQGKRKPSNILKMH